MYQLIARCTTYVTRYYHDDPPNDPEYLDAYPRHVNIHPSVHALSAGRAVIYGYLHRRRDVHARTYLSKAPY